MVETNYEVLIDVKDHASTNDKLTRNLHGT